MSDLKPLVPRWRGKFSTDLWIGAFCVATVEMTYGQWFAETCGDKRMFVTKGEAKAWVEARLYGDSDE